MATLIMPQRAPGRLQFKLSEELHQMFERPSVIITAIVAVTVVVCSFVGALTFLAYTGKGTEALVAAIVTPLVGLLVSMSSRISKIERHTNGTTTRLLDAALTTPTDPGAPQ